MYSPDGFASLLCLMTNQCQFLTYQEPFVKLMQLFHGNYVAFFALQALVWFALIGSIYFLTKTLKGKHLFLTPFLLLFGGSLFIDNYVGNFENDFVAIILFITAMILYLKKHETPVLNLWSKFTSISLVFLGTSIWMWLAYLQIPTLWSEIAEQNWWALILGWNLLTPIYLLCVFISAQTLIKKKKNRFIALMCLFSFCFPKLWFLAIPAMINFIDAGLTKLDFKQNYKFYITLIVFALLLGQFLRVSILTYEAWSFDTSKTNCFTVNHEYFARLQGKSLNYNQASIVEYDKCLKKEALNGTT